MRVLNAIIDPRIGGPQLRALSVAKKLREEEVETIFLIPDGTDEFSEFATEAGFEVTRPGFQKLHPPKQVVKNAQYLTDFFPSVYRIKRTIENLDIDVVHASMTLNFQASVAAWAANIPLAWFFNDTGTPWPLNRIAGYTARNISDDISVAADAVHNHFFSESIESRTVYPPVSIKKFDPESVEQTKEYLSQEFGIQSDRPVIGTVGNINPVKGHRYLLRALPPVVEEIGPVKVLVAGSILKSREKYFENLKKVRAELGLEDSVKFVGRRSDVPQFLASLDLFVFPSVKEACPMAVLEAMAMERTIVATTVGGIPEEITDGEHGWLVPPKDPEALAFAMCDALTSPNAARQRGINARERVKNEFSLEKCTERHKQIYEDILH